MWQRALTVSGGGGGQLSTPQSVSVPPSGATISANVTTRIFVFNLEVGEIAIWENGSLTYRIVGSSYTPNPAPSSTNIYPSYSGNTITLNSNSSATRSVWVVYE